MNVVFMKMMLWLMLVCCLMDLGLGADSTLYFIPHDQAPVSNNISCPDQTPCPRGNTCCQVGEGSQYGCCPYSNAVCCSDGIHCCQRGTKCHPDGGGCVHGDGSHHSVHPIQTDNFGSSVLCPDQEGMCPKGQTCCEGSNRVYACCPFAQGVCCPDKIHCCPHGLTCDLSGGRCVRKHQDLFLSLFSHLLLTKTKAAHHEGSNVVCDTTHECPDGSTCCKLTTGQWGCCPLPQAVCCTDGVHCCPSGYKCDPSSGTCNKGGLSVAWTEKTTPMRKGVGDIHCDRSHECPDGDTCCMMASHQWGCCPMSKAVCCSDGAHCCPNGTTCDMPHGQCKRPDGLSVPWVAKRPHVKNGKTVENIRCDSSHECPDGSTCCKLSTGQWGCCPLPKAVCCSDGSHCCPQGTTCDTTAGKCNRQDGSSVEWFEKTPAVSKKVKDIQCDGSHSCPDGNTCCKLSSGEWGCCPLPQAVCCSDGSHCCPQGTTCDTTAGKCNRQDGSSVEWFEKTPAVSKKVKDIQCDGSHSCPDGNTCCKLSSGEWGCCPLPQAVCCSDGSHCCPQGTTCDTTAGKCNRQDGSSVEWVSKISTVKSDSPVDIIISDSWADSNRNRPLKFMNKVKTYPVTCPGEDRECLDGSTCCQLLNGAWGCCPYQKAVCCSDHVHCCPEGMTCDISTGTCNKDGLSFTWMDKKPSLARKIDGKEKMMSLHFDSTNGITLKSNKVHDQVICSSLGASCPDNETCCPITSSQFGCCPLPKGVCCPDHIHCCPQNSTCSVELKACIVNDKVIDWFERNRGKVTELPTDSLHTGTVDKPLAVMCPDGHSECPDGSTCCKLTSGDYGCCPLPDAVCCSDGIHCCPKGSMCNLTAMTCQPEKGGVSINLYLRHSAHLLLSGEQIICDTTHHCPDESTCCRLSSGQWGCFPLPQAVCCSDRTHCCPQGTTCDTTAGRCNRQDGSFVEWVAKTSAVNKKVKDIQCDGSHSCPDGNTCCKLSSGEWGCCPLPQAVCCSDGSHCCPQGTTCDTTAGKCNRQDGSSIEWFKKTSAVSKTVKDVQCDGSHSCPDASTCCKLSSGNWGCCPLPEAVCCSDGSHCCPQGTTCDTASGTCDTPEGLTLTWFKKHPAVHKTHLGVFTCNGSQKKCDDGQTCCKVADGRIGCCVYTNGVCCSDGTHCCPSGTTCDVESGHCLTGGVSTSWSHIQQEVYKSDLPCGDSTCPDSNTCCRLNTGDFGCCPLPNAVCCSDGVHCCPAGTTCDTTAGKCNRQDGSSFEWVAKTSALSKKVKDIQCDGSHSCPDGNTCCKLSSGEWGCCPLPQAVCCSDGSHCCPQGTTCDTTAGKCNRQDGSSVEWVAKTSAVSKKVKDIQCDGSHSCPDGNTCCKLSSGEWGCCPLPQAVCCSDGSHCCPQGTTCDTTAGKCNRQDGSSVEWVAKTSAVSKKVKDIQCDGSHSCPDGNTCCKLSSGEWGCCPLLQAVCCSDGAHCCPAGTTCDTTAGKCNRQDGSSVEWFAKTSAVSKKVKDIHCDGSHSCPDGNTCCKLSSGEWGCCPLPQAVCCSDGSHCCPQGTTCDTTAGKCNRQDGSSVEWVAKTSAVSKKVKDIQCDGSHSCPDGNTCCKLSSGEWGCCPLPQAVCCSDGSHCCPQGTTCDTTAGKCNRQDGSSVEWVAKTSAVSKKVKDIQCDGSHSCPDGNTCCKLSSGEWGCCPLPQAVCCSDGSHCCPQGTTCDTTAGKCNRQDGSSVEWVAKTSAVSKKVKDIQCDGSHSCPDGNTCCKLSSGEWGCCPLPQAVCCSDGSHCCPQGTTCDTTAGKCNRQDGSSVEWVAKTSAVSKKVKDIQCDGSHSCPDGNTCCKLSSGEWGCCPLPQAVCCSDGSHCCPQGTTCDTTAGKCNRQDGSSLEWVAKTSAVSKKVKDIQCDGSHSCPDGNTCCKLSSGEWGCCPLPQAVCCSDGSHCCPQGTTCDTTAGKCNRQDGSSVEWVAKTSAVSKKVKDIQCDGSHSCPDGNTCCKLSSGEWGCCPLPQAVCCSDGSHCCPQGTTCDTTAGKCNRQDGSSLEWVAKTSAVSKKVKDIQCDGSHSCPDGNTCCKLSSGEWGCCPLPQAVCCSDGSHCCPQGTTCDTTAGKCNRQDGSSIEWFPKILSARK